MKKWIYLVLLLPCIAGAQTSFTESAWLHTDRTLYSTGENIWFSAYVQDAGTGQLSTLSRILYVELIATDLKPVLQQRIALDAGRGAGYFAIDNSISTGVYQLRAYTSWMRNGDAASFYQQELAIINPFLLPKDSSAGKAGETMNPVSSDGGIRLSNSSPGRRQAVTVTLDTLLKTASVSVTRMDKVSGPPRVPFTRRPVLPALTLQRQPVYLPEVEGLLLSGRLTDRATGTPAAKQVAYLGAPGQHYTLTASVSDEKGWIHFNLPVVSGSRELLFHPVVSGGESVVWEQQPAFSDRFVFQPAYALPALREWQQIAGSRNLASQLQVAYGNGVPVEKATAPPILFGEPDKWYELDLFTRFPTLEEVFHEFIPEVRMRKIAGETRFNVKNALFNDFYSSEPLIVIDGVPVSQNRELMGLDPLKVKAIGIYTRKIFIGPEAKEGLIVLQTYKGDLAGYTVDKNDAVISYRGVEKQRSFAAPDYTGNTYASPRIPDRRSLLYWNADLKQQSFDFYTADLDGTWLITVEGLSADGRPIHVEKTFIVR